MSLFHNLQPVPDTAKTTWFVDVVDNIQDTVGPVQNEIINQEHEL